MLAGDAREVARQWVMEEVAGEPDFRGAFYHGSIGWLPSDAELSATSDVDVIVVFDDVERRTKPGKFRHRDVLLEVSYMPTEQFASPEEILGWPQLAGSFRTASVISDPSGRLTRIQEFVSRNYAKRRWVRERCEGIQDNILRFLRSLDEPEPFHDGVSAWLFATGNTTLMPLVAGLRNPTVRKRYAAARGLLAEYGRQDFYDTLLELLGCAWMDRARVEHHLPALVAAFDAAREVIRTPFFFAADISEAGRPVAIDGSREMIAGGDHREAVFWMVATHSRCQKIFDHDAPPLQKEFAAGYQELLADLGIVSFADLRKRGERVRAFLPRLREEADAIMTANKDIEGD